MHCIGYPISCVLCMLKWLHLGYSISFFFTFNSGSFTVQKISPFFHLPKKKSRTSGNGRKQIFK
uniref:Uncharacterized protein n=1 Tax=Anguilla anguilla TaxID=7936 RepID=A0A0E9W725_ANGAN